MTHERSHLIDVTDATDLRDFCSRHLRASLRRLDQARRVALDEGDLFLCEIYAAHAKHIRSELAARGEE